MENKAPKLDQGALKGCIVGAIIIIGFIWLAIPSCDDEPEIPLTPQQIRKKEIQK